MSRKRDRPLTKGKILDSSLAQLSQICPSFTLPLTAMRTTHESTIKHCSMFFRIIHHRRYQYIIFPTASCLSRHEEADVEADYENEPDRDLRLPGIHMKRTNESFGRTVGEFEINQLMINESGWDRVKHMYRMKSGIFEDDGLKALNTMWYRTVMIGFFVNAMIGSMKQDKLEKSLSKTDAVRKGVINQVLIPKKILQTALKDTLKLSIFSLSVLHLSQTISAYRNKTSIWEFTFSSAIGFGSVGMMQGPYRCGVLTAAGAILGTVGGWLVCQVLQSSGLTQESRNMKRMQQRVEESRLQLETEE